jgi:hypothetical protein
MVESSSGTNVERIYKCIKVLSYGYKNNMKLYEVSEYDLPRWIGNEDFHNSHKSNLLRKDYNFYSKYGWNIESDLPYIWSI